MVSEIVLWNGEAEFGLIGSLVCCTFTIIAHLCLYIYFPAFAAQVSSIPIVDDNDSLLDVYSRRSVFTGNYLKLVSAC